MAAPEFWQRILPEKDLPFESVDEYVGDRSSGAERVRISLDVITILGAAIIATLHQRHLSPSAAWNSFCRGTLFPGHSSEILVALLGWFALWLVMISRDLDLYTNKRAATVLGEQRRSVQACLTSGLLLTGTLYLLHAEYVPRSIVLLMLGIVTIALGLRRLVLRLSLNRSLEKGIGTRNVLIVGAGPTALAMRHQLENVRSLGYVFQGFFDLPWDAWRTREHSADIAGVIDALFQQVRKQFVDEIFVTERCEGQVLEAILARARKGGIDIRLVPDLFGGLAWRAPVEYLGQFPTIPLHNARTPEAALFLKRVMDVMVSLTMLVLAAPLMMLIAIAVKLETRGPALYVSERIGKKGRVFRCFKFRTMVADAENRLSDVMHLNERKGVLFKIADDPRVTRIGHFLRKYSLDEFPQFFNVLCGHMSVVGPRPPIAREVRKYEMKHLRRLDVMPGITGLWQIQAREDPSFDRYISLDMHYVRNWSLWLDIKIMVRTAGAVFAGTGR